MTAAGAPTGGDACRLGLLAVGDSITNGNGDPMLGVPARSWALWLAQALELPYTNLARDGAVVADLVREQLPRVRGEYDLACCYAGVNDVRNVAWSAEAFDADLRRVLTALSSSADRLVVATIPLDLGRPRAGAVKVGEANAIIARHAREQRAIVVDLADLAGWQLVLPDAVHPTARGQLEIADRAAAALKAAGIPVAHRPSTALCDPDDSTRGAVRYALTAHAAQLARDLTRRGLERRRRR
jgi:lysophospholipase L1-like esterase